MSGGDIQSNRYVTARSQFRSFDGSYNEFNGLAVRFEARSVTAFVTDEITFVARIV